MVRTSFRSSLAVVGVALVASMAAPACVGDEPPASAAKPDDDPSSDAAAGDASAGDADGEVRDGGNMDSGGNDAGEDAAVSCQDFETACSGACVDLTSAKTDCGACGHDCGGGACIDSVCQTVVVRDGLDRPVFDIDGENLYFSSADKLLSCPLGGCGGKPPRQVGVAPHAITGAPAGTVRVGGGNVVFFAPSADEGHEYLYRCPTSTGCATPPENISSNGLQSFGGAVVARGADIYWNLYRQVRHASCTSADKCASLEPIFSSSGAVDGVLAVDDNRVYFTEKSTDKTILSCPKSGSGCAPTTIGTTAKSITQIAAQGQKVWILSSGGDGYIDGSIRWCPTNEPTCSGTLFADKLPFPTFFAVDDGAVTWINRDGHGGAPEIVTCPITGCAGGPRTLAKVDAKARDLRSDERFVYWATDTRILRVAK